MNKKDNFITNILIFLIFIIIFTTIYFCLDVFGIIHVPSKFSIASLFYSQIEVIATGGEMINENTVSKDENRIIQYVKEKDDEQTEGNVEYPIDQIKSNNDNKQDEENDTTTNDSGKIIYDKLYENKDKLKTGNYTADFDTTFDDLLHTENGSEVLNNAFQLAINSLTFDNPELFYLDITKINLLTEITSRTFSKTYRVSIGGNGQNYLLEEFQSQDNVENVIKEVEQIKSNIISNSSQGTDDVVEILRNIHDYLVDNTEYDASAGKNVYNIYGTLVKNKAVCEGYARSYKYILDELGIPCIIACGIAQNKSGVTESHAWNYVKINENWYAVDVTWDDPIIRGNGKITKSIRYKYFLVGSNNFFQDHAEDGNIAEEYNFTYPEISKEDL